MNSILEPELLRLSGPVRDAWGGDQAWYRKLWQRKAGCGPTACANLIWYLSKSRSQLRQLWPEEGKKRSDMLRLMEETWKYVTPTVMGVNRTEILADGAVRFGRDRGIPLSAPTLEIPSDSQSRPEFEQLKAFLGDAFSKDIPVAFLNLDSGALNNLESWHWVTLIALENDGQAAVMLDQGRRVEIELKLWYETTRKSGGFVYIIEE